MHIKSLFLFEIVSLFGLKVNLNDLPEAARLILYTNVAILTLLCLGEYKRYSYAFKLDITNLRIRVHELLFDMQNS